MLQINRNGKLKSGNKFMELISKIICRLVGHKYKSTRKISRQITELRCPRCGKEFVIHTGVQSLLPLDKDLIRIHNDVLLNN